MNYIIQEVDLTDLRQQKQVNALMNAAFSFGLQGNEVWLSTHSQSGFGKALYLGAFSDGDLVGFNAYIPHDMLLDGDRLVAYQSCWSAVSPNHRKQGLFIRLQEAARAPLKAQGAIAIIGLPNQLSGPILTGPLAYEDKGGFLRTTLLLPSHFPLKKTSFTHLPPNSLSPAHDQLLSLKMQQPSKHILSGQDEKGNVIWGKYAQVKKWGVSVRHFLVGGVALPESAGFPALIKTFSRKHRIRLMTFVYHHSSDYKALFRKNMPSDSGYLCWYPLDEEFKGWERFNFGAGLSDVF